MNIERATRIILFASLISITIILVDNNNVVFADAKSDKTVQDYKVIKSKIQEDVKELKSVEDSDKPQHEKDVVKKEIQRLNKNIEIVDLRIKLLIDPENADKYGMMAMEIFEELEEMVGAGTPSQKIQNHLGYISNVFHINTEVNGSDVKRYDCTESKNVNSDFTATVDTHYPFTSTWYSN